MIKPEVLDFCEDYKISIKKFLQENYSIIPSKSNKRYRIKHREIADFMNLIPVSLFFAFRYPELVVSGKLVIVEDDYHKYNVYINPRIIQETLAIVELEEELSSLDEDLIEDLVKTRMLLRKIADLKENEAIINHFHGTVEETNTRSLYQKRKSLGLTRVQKGLENNC